MPLLFAMYIRQIGGRLIEGGSGIKMGQLIIQGIFFADNMVILRENQDDLQNALDVAAEEGIS